MVSKSSVYNWINLHKKNTLKSKNKYIKKSSPINNENIKQCIILYYNEL